MGLSHIINLWGVCNIKVGILPLLPLFFLCLFHIFTQASGKFLFQCPLNIDLCSEVTFTCAFISAAFIPPPLYSFTNTYTECPDSIFNRFWGFLGSHDIRYSKKVATRLSFLFTDCAALIIHQTQPRLEAFAGTAVEG